LTFFLSGAKLVEVFEHFLYGMELNLVEQSAPKQAHNTVYCTDDICGMFDHLADVDLF
jgi:hypothetical protein